MSIILLSILDILAGIFLLASDFIPGKWALYLGVILLIKGIFFLGSAIASGSFEWMSVIDIFIGIVLIFHLEIGWLALVPIVKGIYCIALTVFVY